jgi:asparagine synthase (glutamine-hydrolysing)
MCGIVGIISPKGVNHEDLTRVRNRLIHRGPDSNGNWISEDKKVGFGHQRLAIVELSPLGHQPMSLYDDSFVIVFNGEIYNYLELKRQLEQIGARFRSHSDTEVIIQAYKYWGTACIDKFVGMFAFAIYDKYKQIIILARDRAGEKPLYYSYNRGTFQFASESKALNVENDLDLRGLNQYLAFGYIPNELTLNKNIRKFPKASIGIFDIHKQKLVINQYWSLPKNIDRVGQNEEILVEELGDLLDEAVKLQLRSDVPTGIFLSGGLDSSLVVAAAARNNSNKLKTFNVTFPNHEKFDESQYAKQIADHFGTDHHVIPITNLGLDVLDEIIPYLDQPIADSSIIPTHLVSKYTKKFVTVALGGDGGDELFGGYSHYNKTIQDLYLRRFGNIHVNKFMGNLAALLPAGVRGRNRLQSLRAGNAMYFRAWDTPFFDLTLRKRILSMDLQNELGEDLLEPELYKMNELAKEPIPIESMTRLDFNSYLVDDVITKVDRMSMINSLEVRAPFLDHRIIEYSFKNIGKNLKATSTNTRIIEKKLAQKMLPEDFNINRKQGFSIPLDDWLRNDSKQSFRKYLGNINRVFNQREVEKLINGQFRGRKNGSRLFSLFIINSILEKH